VIAKKAHMKNTMQAVLLAAAAVVYVALPQAALAQPFPSKPIRIIVPIEPGGSVDMATRTVAPRMSEDLGQPVIVENRSGAGGQIGAQFVARSAPDGHTIMFNIGAAHILTLYAYKNPPFHAVKDFTPITILVDTVLAIGAGTDFPPNNLKEAIEYTKRNPGKVSYGHTGVGGLTHLLMEQIRVLSGTDMQHVPFKGGGPLMINLVGGQLQMGMLPVVLVVKQKKAKVLAIVDNKRYPVLPDVMAVSEAVPNFELLEGGGIWVFGPAGMSSPIVNRLHAAIVKALAAPEVRAKLEPGGQIPNGEAPAVLAAKVKSMADIAGRLMKLAGVEPE
jgi:tripartite-type tricarboxylate transporter receptor subunit TctC